MRYNFVRGDGVETDKEKLIAVIYNDTSRDNEIDDAVIVLSKFVDDDVIQILMKVAKRFIR